METLADVRRALRRLPCRVYGTRGLDDEPKYRIVPSPGLAFWWNQDGPVVTLDSDNIEELIDDAVILQGREFVSSTERPKLTGRAICYNRRK